MIRIRSLIIFIALIVTSCYSFKGISIPPDVNSFYIEPFTLRASNAPGGLQIDFADRLNNKINNESRLVYNDTSPDIEFSGSISSFRVSAVAPQQNADGLATTAFNRLNITVAISYINNTDEEDTWDQSFSFFQDFESTEDLSNVQDDLIDAIFEQILEDIFNKAFTNW